MRTAIPLVFAVTLLFLLVSCSVSPTDIGSNNQVTKAEVIVATVKPATPTPLPSPTVTSTLTP